MTVISSVELNFVPKEKTKGVLLSPPPFRESEIVKSLVKRSKCLLTFYNTLIDGLLYK